MAPAEKERDDSEAALRPVGGVADIQVVGALSERIAALLGLSTGARSVWMHQDTVGHVVTRRDRDAEFVLEHLPGAILRPQFVGIEFCDADRVRLVHRLEKHDCYVHVAIKLVVAAEAGSGIDELWVSTAYKMGARSLTRLRKKTTLWRVEEV